MGWWWIINRGLIPTKESHKSPLDISIFIIWNSRKGRRLWRKEAQKTTFSKPLTRRARPLSRYPHIKKSSIAHSQTHNPSPKPLPSSNPPSFTLLHQNHHLLPPPNPCRLPTSQTQGTCFPHFPFQLTVSFTASWI